MVAYSFKAQFIEPIRTLRKRQTLRNDRARHARPGEPVQLYTAMRTKQCRKIGDATCTGVDPIRINFALRTVIIADQPRLYRIGDLNDFARADGFEEWRDLFAFWQKEHGTVDTWSGVIIRWHDFKAPA